MGNEIAARLLADSDSRLLLLIRAPDDAQALARLDELAAYWRMDPRAVRMRAAVIRGDTALPRFGLSEAQYRSLHEAVTHIVHCAALVRMNLPLEQALRSAVRSAANVIELARACRASGQLEKVEFLSTVGVAGRMPGMLPERWIGEERTFHNTNEQAKAEAERLVSDACAAGLPITVTRPSMVVGNAGSGRILRFQVFYHLVEFLSGSRTRGIYPALGAARLDLVPVDFVSRVVTWSSTTTDTAGRILHLCSGPAEALPLVELRELVRARLRALGHAVPRAYTVPHPVAANGDTACPRARSHGGETGTGHAAYFSRLPRERTSFGNEQTKRLLARTGVQVPVPREFVGRSTTIIWRSGDRVPEHRPPLQDAPRYRRGSHAGVPQRLPPEGAQHRRADRRGVRRDRVPASGRLYRVDVVGDARRNDRLAHRPSASRKKGFFRAGHCQSVDYLIPGDAG